MWTNTLSGWRWILKQHCYFKDESVAFAHSSDGSAISKYFACASKVLLLAASVASFWQLDSKLLELEFKISCALVR
ncbi:hypothetical protein VPH35_073187 [Triticum aestivum]